jgi:hypothetical protein
MTPPTTISKGAARNAKILKSAHKNREVGIKEMAIEFDSTITKIKRLLAICGIESSGEVIYVNKGRRKFRPKKLYKLKHLRRIFGDKVKDAAEIAAKRKCSSLDEIKKLMLLL